MTFKMDEVLAGLLVFKRQGSEQQPQKYNIESETGSEHLFVYDVMPGLKLAFTKFTGSEMSFHHPELCGVMQINYCLNGRMGWMMQDGSAIYLGPGDLALHMMDCCAISSITLPLGYYTGIILFVNLEYLTENPSDIFSEIKITPQEWKKKFCAGGRLTVVPGLTEAAEIFSFLPRVGEEYRTAYFKLKALELLLLLSMLDIKNIQRAESYENEYIQTIKKLHAKLTDNWQQRFTIDTLAREFLINPSLLKKLFKSVYGKPVAQYMKEYRMHKAAALLLKAEGSVAEVARASGYTSQSKFAAAFKDVMQISPAEYRLRYAAVKQFDKVFQFGII